MARIYTRRKAPRIVIKGPKTSEFQKLKKDVHRLKASNETKYHDENFPAGTIAYASNSVTTLVDPAQGDSKNERVGDDISPFWMDIRGQVKVNGSSTSQGTRVRMIIIQTKKRFTPVTNVTSASQGVLQSQGTAETVNQPFDWDNRQFFTVLYDRTFQTSDNNGTGTGGNNASCIPFHIKRKISKPVKYAAGTTTAESGQVYMLLYSDTNSATENPIVQFYSRVLYKD